ncbi:hypothetical protein HNP38_000530 [Chryseobacterium defluvii]|uniref:DUF2971 family protein n=1 Tax=Chryseobacterium defluvii TaxID=160396 RepID=A0A840KBA8_9FLAO|nr:DUF2971 domain-containing protein [Chryseobacterium defluvii]MBB4805258.1 hypothetical protein [Chryseobacterium defluvii]
MIYRFRTAEALLDRFHELDNQEIYFASPKELNDPMEGFKDLFWKGDEIVWKNFLINYVKSLEAFFSLTVLTAETVKLKDEDIKVLSHRSAMHPPEHKKLMDDIIKEIFAYKYISTIPKSLANRASPVRREELLSYLNFFHQYVINAISKLYFEKGYTDQKYFYNSSEEFDELQSSVGNMVELINAIESENGKSVVDTLFTVTIQMMTQVKLRGKKSIGEKELNTNSFLLVSEFPEKYLSRLEESIYPEWYTASFLTDNTNSAIWGHYGDNHKGICLIFKTQTDENNKEFLSLDTESGYGSGGPVRAIRPHRFHKIEYTRKHIEIDFFRSMGRLSKEELNAMWYSDENGNMSICGEHLNKVDDNKEWKDGYWDNFYKSITTKLDEWAYEKEFRIILNDGFYQYNDKKDRKLKYDFNDLEGIIFGIKTDIADKLKAIRIIERKCKENGRKDFNIYQAYYSKETGKIEKFKIDVF